jgi:signal transduction histidine kinase
LWFVGFDNLVSIDPAAIDTNAVPPPVHIQSIASGGTTYSTATGVRLPVGASNLQIKYTALSLSMPDRVRFRYRLDGVDAEWQEAGTRREAFYTNLGPGSYRFQVIAANNDGVWNDAGATLAFVIPAAYYQATWFRVLCTLAAAAAAWGMYRRHVRRLAVQMQGRIEERLTERERIARELHDTLLQGFQGLVLRFQAVATTIPSTDPSRTLMEDALARADDVLVEGRDRVRGLRGAASAVGDLAAALAQFGEQLARDASAEFSVVIEGEPRALHPVVRDEAYWIGREALVNAFHHAEARRVEVEIAFGSRDLRLRLRDDGRGLEPEVLKKGGRAEHWGLPGMRERASRIGGRLELWSRAGAGTEVELRVPSPTAYPPAERRHRPSRWWRAARGVTDGR